MKLKLATIITYCHYILAKMGYKMKNLLLKWTEILRETSGVCSPSPTSHPRLCQNGNKVTNHLIHFIIQDFRIYFGNRIDFLVSILQTCLPQYQFQWMDFCLQTERVPLLHFHQFSAPFSTLDKNTIFTTLTILLLSLPLPLPVPVPLLLLLLAVVMMIMIIIMWFRRPMQCNGGRGVVHVVW